MTSFVQGINRAFDFSSHSNPKFEIIQVRMPWLESFILGVIMLITAILFLFKTCKYYANATSSNLTYYLQMRKPKFNFGFSLCFNVFYWYLFLTSSHVINYSFTILFIMISLFCSFVAYTNYLLFFSHYHQQLIVGGLQQPNNASIFNRFGDYISHLMAKKSFYHENLLLWGVIIYNLIFISLCILFETLSLGIAYYILYIKFHKFYC